MSKTPTTREQKPAKPKPAAKPKSGTSAKAGAATTRSANTKIRKQPPAKIPAPAPAAAPTEPAAPQLPAAKTKLQTITDLLGRPQGATITELMTATGWQAHSVRGAMAGALKKQGVTVTSVKDDGQRRYSTVVPSCA